MAILLELTPQEEADARARAESEGISVTDLFRRYLRISPEKSFDDIVAPLREDFQQSDMTEDELDDFVGRLVDRARTDLSVQTPSR